MTTSVSPDRRYALVVWSDHSGRYLLESVCARDEDGWFELSTGSGEGVGWSSAGAGGVTYLTGRAPPGARAAVVRWHGGEHHAPVRDGWFVWIAWGTDSYDKEPELVGFVGS